MNTPATPTPAYNGATRSAPVSSEPVYSRRCGYWILFCFGLLGGLSCLASVAYFFISEADLKVILLEQNLLIDNLLGYKIFLALGSVSLIITLQVLRSVESLTTEPGNFWIVFGLWYVPLFFFNGVNIFKEPFKVMNLLFVSIKALAPALIWGAIMTIPEEYEGCMACLKCLKPYKVEQIIPVSTPNSGKIV